MTMDPMQIPCGPRCQKCGAPCGNDWTVRTCGACMFKEVFVLPTDGIDVVPATEPEPSPSAFPCAVYPHGRQLDDDEPCRICGKDEPRPVELRTCACCGATCTTGTCSNHMRTERDGDRPWTIEVPRPESQLARAGVTVPLCADCGCSCMMPRMDMRRGSRRQCACGVGARTTADGRCEHCKALRTGDARHPIEPAPDPLHEQLELPL
jgi:hypothetical protein